MVGVSAALAMTTSGETSILWWGATLLWWTGFYGLLRPGEGWRMTRADVALPSDLCERTKKPSIVIRIGCPKNWKHFRKVFKRFESHTDVVSASPGNPPTFLLHGFVKSVEKRVQCAIEDPSRAWATLEYS